MIRKFLAAAAVMTALSAPAFAADMPVKAARMMPAPTFNWTGLYLGVHAGYGWDKLGGFTNQKGGLVGGQIGYNWQPVGSPWVLGVELDSAWAQINETVTATAPAFGLTATAESNTSYLGSARARVGYAWDRALIYATGGAGWARNRVSVTASAFALVVGASASATHFGYTVGGGLEYAFAGPWSAKAEYLYYGLSNESYFGGPGVDLNVHTVKVGVNYRFGAL